jgi:hypothetical protein
MKNIAQKIGLAAEATEDAILAEVTRLQSRLTTLEPFEAENLKLKNRMRQIDEDAVAGLLAERKIADEKIVNRLKPVLTNFASRAERVAFLDDCGFNAEAGTGHREIGTGTGTQQTKLRNRDTRPPKGGKPSEASNDEAPSGDPAKAVKIMNRARELQKATPSLCDATAVIMAQREMSQRDAGPNY